jgi:TRAP-type mannitol/chloroaromatic compound transport system permease small subunit
MSIKMAPVVNGINAISETVGKAVSLLFIALVFTVSIDLLTRYFTGRSTFWAFDINYMIFGTNFMLAGAYAMKHDSHVRVDVIYQQFSPRTRAVLDVVFLALVMIPLSSFMFYSTWIDFLNSVAARETSMVSSWRPPIYPYKAVMPLAFLLLLLQSIGNFITSSVIAVKGDSNVG